MYPVSNTYTEMCTDDADAQTLKLKHKITRNTVLRVCVCRVVPTSLVLYYRPTRCPCHRGTTLLLFCQSHHSVSLSSFPLTTTFVSCVGSKKHQKYHVHHLQEDTRQKHVEILDITTGYCCTCPRAKMIHFSHQNTTLVAKNHVGCMITLGPFTPHPRFIRLFFDSGHYSWI